MRVISCDLRNFASYKKLSFNFDNQGLALIHGPTGSGKSTLCDAIPWVLFGRTAKGGAVDEILTWPGGQVTTGTLQLSDLSVTRTRGPKANDLFFTKGGIVTRGKDIPDTQRLLNNLIQVDIDLYLAGAYFHEFSQTAQFFTTTAKNRRAICEQLVDLSLPIKLQEQTSIKLKANKAALATIEQQIAKSTNKIETLVSTYSSLCKQQEDWTAAFIEEAAFIEKRRDKFSSENNKEIKSLEKEIRNSTAQPVGYFDAAIAAIKADIPKPTEKCPTCGTVKKSPEYEQLLETIRDLETEKLKNDYALNYLARMQADLIQLVHRENPYIDQLELLMSETNPHNATIAEIEAQHDKEQAALTKAEKQKAEYSEESFLLQSLSEIASQFRGILIENAISDLQEQTNALLERHFDAELRVELTASEADKVEVIISKDGNTCSYTQLSKGQRQLLKLCFGISVMKAVSNHHGVTFDQVFFDEALDGLDANFKVKAYGLLEALSLDYESIFVVEHSSELKEMFNNKFAVALTNQGSQISGPN